MSAATVWNKRKLTFVIVSIWVLTAILQTPQLFWFNVVTDSDCLDPTKTVFAFRRITNDKPYYELRKNLYVISPMVIVVVPLIALITLNLLLLYYLRLNNQNLNQLGSSSKNRNTIERIVTKRISFIVITFFLFNFPSAVLGVWTTYESNEKVYHILTDIPVEISDNLVIISKAINFPLYCCINSSFRNQLAILFYPVRKFYSLINGKHLSSSLAFVWRIVCMSYSTCLPNDFQL